MARQRAVTHRFSATAQGHGTSVPVIAWAVGGLLAFVLLPWHAVHLGLLSIALPGALVADSEAASALWQAVLYRKPWLFAGLLGLVACAIAARIHTPRAQGWGLAIAGFGAAACIAWFGFFAPGDGLARVGGGLSTYRPGYGWGACVVLTSLIVLGAFGLARLGAFRGDALVSALAVCSACALLVFVAYPVLRGLSGAFLDDSGAISLRAALERAGNERVWGLGCVTSRSSCGVAWNTLFLALLSAAGTTFLGTVLALVEYRSNWSLKPLVKLLAPLPIITPPFVAGLALILVFGRSGVVSQLLEYSFGVSPSRWFYGLFGLWLAQMFAFTPVAFLIMRGVVQSMSPSLEEVARTLRASPRHTFHRITLPLLAPGFASAFLVGFIESISDFGNPIIVGGQYSVLSTEIFFAIVGAQFEQGRAAALAWVLALFALGVFAAQRTLLGSTSYATVTGKETSGTPLMLPTPWRQLATGIAAPWLVLTVSLYVFAISAGFVEVWGRDYTPTLNHLRRAFEISFDSGTPQLTGLAWSSLLTTIKLAAIAAPVSAVAGLLLAWLLSRADFLGQAAIEYTVLMAFAIPGTVLGLSYILVFNVPPIEITGTGAIIVLCFVFRNLPVSVRAGAAILRQLDTSLEEASTVLGASTLSTLRHVVLPLLKPALVASLIYGFVRSMTTVSAVVFLVTAETELATTFIIGRVGQGEYGVAFAYSAVLIVLMTAVTALIEWWVGDLKFNRVTPASRLSEAR